jgi:hypothetical protein
MPRWRRLLGTWPATKVGGIIVVGAGTCARLAAWVISEGLYTRVPRTWYEKIPNTGDSNSDSSRYSKQIARERRANTRDARA